MDPRAEFERPCERYLKIGLWVKQPDVIGRLIFARAVASFYAGRGTCGREIGGGRSRRRDGGG